MSPNRPVPPAARATRPRSPWAAAASLCLALSVFALGAGCTTQTMILSKPEGAKVMMDDTRLLGQTPILLKEQAWVWTKHRLEFTLEGYQPERLEIEGSVRWGNVLATLYGCVTCLVWPLALLGQLPPEVIAVMRPDYSVDPFATSMRMVASPEIDFD